MKSSVRIQASWRIVRSAANASRSLPIARRAQKVVFSAPIAPRSITTRKRSHLRRSLTLASAVVKSKAICLMGSNPLELRACWRCVSRHASQSFVSIRGTMLTGVNHRKLQITSTMWRNLAICLRPCYIALAKFCPENVLSTRRLWISSCGLCTKNWIYMIVLVRSTQIPHLPPFIHLNDAFNDE